MRHCPTLGLDPFYCTLQLLVFSLPIAQLAMLVVSGSCCGFLASVPFDCSVERSLVCTQFALRYVLPRQYTPSNSTLLPSTSALLMVLLPYGFGHQIRVRERRRP